MKKVKFGASFFLLILLGFVSGQVLMLINYLLALSLHELAHLFVSIKKGYTLKKIKIDMFGMSVDINEKIDNRDVFGINIAGPFFNLLLCVFCMALYWVIPNSFFYLNSFCMSNFIIAIFNLLPVYPLDGGKIFHGLIKNGRTYKRLNIIIRISFSLLFITLFIFTCFVKPNLIFLLFAIFFIISKNKNESSLSLFKYKNNKSFDKVVIIKVNETETLFNLIKQIKLHHYTIFYCPKLNKYFDEDVVIDISSKHRLDVTLREIN